MQNPRKREEKFKGKAREMRAGVKKQQILKKNQLTKERTNGKHNGKKHNQNQSALFTE